MIIGYNVPDMTHLRYYMPLMAAIRRVRPDAQHEFIVGVCTTKYNSIFRESNYRRYLEIIGNACSSVTRPTCTYDILFTVEGYNSVAVGQKTYAIQHGFDYRASAAACHPDTIHIMSAQEYVTDLQAIVPGRTAVISPVPISMWDVGVTAADEPRRATIFYPESGLHDIVSDVIAGLRSNDWHVVIKQRAKNQAVPDIGVAVHYDRDWYPCESIYLPVMSDVSIGFGTSAYTDLVPGGVNFIDIPIPDYSRAYLKPKHPCMIELSPNSTAEQIVARVVECRRIPIAIDVATIDEFVKGLL